jgi:hypothetical protein
MNGEGGGMSGGIHFGDEVTQFGDHNVGMIKNQAPVDPRTALREMVTAVRTLRGELSPADLQVVDESLGAIGDGQNVDRGTLRRALGAIAGVAAMVGQVGVPVIEAVRRATGALGM